MVEKIDCNGSQNLICTKKKLEIGNEIWKIRKIGNLWIRNQIRKFKNPKTNPEIRKRIRKIGNPETNSESRKLGNPETNSENGKLRNPETNSEETNSEIDRISKNVRKIWFIAQAWNDWVGKKKVWKESDFWKWLKCSRYVWRKAMAKGLFGKKVIALGALNLAQGNETLGANASANGRNLVPWGKEFWMPKGLEYQHKKNQKLLVKKVGKKAFETTFGMTGIWVTLCKQKRFWQKRFETTFERFWTRTNSDPVNVFETEWLAKNFSTES